MGTYFKTKQNQTKNQKPKKKKTKKEGYWPTYIQERKVRVALLGATARRFPCNRWRSLAVAIGDGDWNSVRTWKYSTSFARHSFNAFTLFIVKMPSRSSTCILLFCT